ncbi:nucleoside triphosphate pyrophosphohydrolase [Chromatocurvus halotolerans]|uniref:Nucleoside triphosphate pyrophosphohydrolase n=1 Tax=Chromatocurvus halotolerans TaxID=1132028 RepID=A0A4R2LEL4_9GAMM|nr:nucleoside triphosphate pyrophosphohydrolase [Chromatocurvus halotolerans]TCO77735.1 ATP diphosphatase [Chromatocurvus halotolerans]
MTDTRYDLNDLLRIMQRLRDPDGGCPWDLKQDFQSIVPSTIEECYELAEAIEQEDYPHVAEELGDVLFQVIFYAQLGSERALFDFHAIVHTLADKLVRRHPHVFVPGDLERRVDPGALDEADVKAQWEAIKREERRARDQHHALADVPVALPALQRSQKLQKRAAHAGFDWSDSDGVLDKLEEEIAELRAAMHSGESDAVEDEMGDVLFTCVNLARWLKLDAERALRRASGKFERRFRRVEELAGARGATLDSLDPIALDELWQAAKADV